ncbi:MAG: hypothetical protein GAK43_01937 [Stenotrophomonas maltophilia]|nr:MAG: hypothetical protein GAK43_01937 [Stenotrophomonas maltophilia]
MTRAAQFFLVCLALAFWWAWPGTSPVPAPVAAVNAAPGQPFRLVRYTLYPLQSFELQARILHREDYHFDRESELSPTDLALGWGPMADPAVLAQVRITQGNRWYHWHAERMPLPRREIETHSANMHLIPGDAQVARTLANLREGQTIELQGELVKVVGDDGWTWISSLSREDTGAGACELIWVQHLAVR